MTLVNRFGNRKIFYGADHCLAPGTRVLRADLQWVPIETLKKGDDVIAFDEEVTKKGSGNGRYLRTAKVSRVSRVQRPSYLIETVCGIKMVASRDHLWLAKTLTKNGKPAGRPQQWVKTWQLKKGFKLPYFGSPWNTDTTWEGGYIAGFLDGEGSVYIPRRKDGRKFGAYVSFGQKADNLGSYVAGLLRKKGFGVSVGNRSRFGFSPGTRSYHINGQPRTGFRVLGQFRPQRLLKKVLDGKAWEGMRLWGGHGKPRVVKNVRYLGVREVVALETSTKTFIAEGIYTHNSQLEIRILGQMSGDKLLISLLNSGEDIHSAVGHELTGWPIARIAKDRETRTTVKGIHFGIIYGLSPWSLYETLKVEAIKNGQEFTLSFKRVEKLYKRYFVRFKGVAEYIEDQVALAQEYGYVETLFGFRREVIQAGDDTRKTFWKNQAVNAPIQGSAHQLLQIAIALLNLKKKTYNLLQDLTLEIHDSLVGFIQLQNMELAHQQAVQLLSKDVLVQMKKWWPKIEWKVPLLVEAKAGFRYGCMVDYAGESPGEFLEKWCQKNQQLEKKWQEQFKLAV